MLRIAEGKQNHCDECLNIELCSKGTHRKRYLLLPVTCYCRSGQLVTETSDVSVTTILLPVFEFLSSPKIPSNVQTSQNYISFTNINPFNPKMPTLPLISCSFLFRFNSTPYCYQHSSSPPLLPHPPFVIAMLLRIAANPQMHKSLYLFSWLPLERDSFPEFFKYQQRFLQESPETLPAEPGLCQVCFPLKSP